MGFNKNQTGGYTVSGGTVKSNALFSKGSQVDSVCQDAGVWRQYSGGAPDFDTYWIYERVPQTSAPHTPSSHDLINIFNQNVVATYRYWNEISAPAVDSIDVSVGSEWTYIDTNATMQYSFKLPAKEASIYELNRCTPYAFTDRLYVQFDVSVSEIVAGDPETKVGDFDIYKGQGGLDFSWSFNLTEPFKTVAFSNNSIDYPQYGDNNPYGPESHSLGIGSSSRTFRVRYSTSGGREGNFNLGNEESDWFSIADNAEVFWELSLVKNAIGSGLRTKETLTVDGVTVFESPDPLSDEDESNTWIKSYGGSLGERSRFEPSGADLTTLKKYLTSSARDIPNGTFEHPIDPDVEQKGPSNIGRFIEVEPSGNQARQATQNLLGEPKAVSSYTEGQWYAKSNPSQYELMFNQASFEILSFSTYDALDRLFVRQNGAPPDVQTDSGAIQVSWSNIECGFGGYNTPTSSKLWLGPDAKTGGSSDWQIPAGAYDVTEGGYSVFPLLPFRSNVFPKTQALFVDSPRPPKTNTGFTSEWDSTGQVDSWEGAWDFGIESGSLPSGVELIMGQAVKTGFVTANQTGTVQFYVIGQTGDKILSDVYSWETVSSTLSIDYGQGSSDTPINKGTWLADHVWLIGGTTYDVTPSVAGGSAPYSFNYRLLDRTRGSSSTLGGDMQLPFETSTGKIGPLPYNSTATDLLSSRGPITIEVTVTDSVGAKAKQIFSVQVINATGVVEYANNFKQYDLSYTPYYNEILYYYNYEPFQQWYTSDPNYDLTFFEDRFAQFDWVGVDRMNGEDFDAREGDISVFSGSLPTDFLTGLRAYNYGNIGTDSAFQLGLHRETSETTGAVTLQLQMPDGEILYSRELTWIAKVGGDFMTFEYEQDPFVHPNATADSNYDHIWADGGYTLEIDPESLPDRILYRESFRLIDGTLPEGVTLNYSTGELEMNGAVLGSEATGSYTIMFRDYFLGVRIKTYTWKREGLGGI